MIDGLLHPHTLIVQQVSDGVPNDAGEVTEVVTERSWGPCNVQQETSDERKAKLSVSGPLAPWIAEHDKIIFMSTTYRVEGTPAHFWSGALDHTELHLVVWNRGK